ncbi:hypothetical protein LIER_01081 [Lithospermum erythrorhizon]|uniref:Uncharacterized protein n=1 Tax=Lithospermum erythrorhizon TaxID=34254 RepID=A0AAV3NP75_LITER
MKEWYRLREGTSIWSSYMKIRYFPNAHPVLVGVPSYAYPISMQLVSIRPQAEDQIHWIIGKGEKEFWIDSWLDSGPILNSPIPTRRSSVKIKDFFEGNTWEATKVQMGAPPDKIQEILNYEVIEQEDD